MITLTAGDVLVELLPEVGGRIHRLSIDGTDLLRTPSDPGAHRREPLYWGSYPMVPWCNRIPRGELRFQSRTWRQLLTTEGHAIHGRAYTRPWAVVEDGVLESDDPGDAAFPWPYLARQELTVTGDGLSLVLSIENRGASAMPAGLGIHPWFAPASRLEVALPADRVYPSSGNIPTGPSALVDGARDLRSFRRPDPGLDECWTGLTGSWIELRRTDVGAAFRYGYSDAADHVVLAHLGELDAIAIEPQTHVPDGHARRERGEEGGIGVLEPGESLRVRYEIVRG